MDEFEKRLKEDAANIQADVSLELKARIESSVHATDRIDSEAQRTQGRHRPGPSSWWLSGLTGLVAALVIIALLNRNTAVDPVVPVQEPTATVVPEYVQQFNTDFYLKVENALFTAPLENELEKLKSDLEKVKNNVEQDLPTTF